MSDVIGLDKVRQNPAWADFDEAEYRRVFGTDEEIRERRARFRKDHAFLESPCVRDEYPGEYVVAYDGQVIAHTVDWHELGRLLVETGSADLDYAITRVAAR